MFAQKPCGVEGAELHASKTSAAALKRATAALEPGFAQATVVRTVCVRCCEEPAQRVRLPRVRVGGDHGPAEGCRVLRERGGDDREEATLRTVTPEFWAEHSIAELEGKSEYWLGSRSRPLSGRWRSTSVRSRRGTRSRPWSNGDKHRAEASRLVACPPQRAGAPVLPRGRRPGDGLVAGGGPETTPSYKTVTTRFEKHHEYADWICSQCFDAETRPPQGSMN